MQIDYIEELKKQYRAHRDVSMWAYPDFETDEQFVKCLGIPTWWLKFDVQGTTRTHYAALKKLEKEGRVISYSNSPNSRFWWPVGFAAELTNGRN